MEDLEDENRTSTSEDTESDKESGVTQIEVRTMTTTTTTSTMMTTLAPGGGGGGISKVAKATPEATYLRMDGKSGSEAVLEAGDGDNRSDITVEEERRGGRERPEEIDASTERYRYNLP